VVVLGGDPKTVFSDVMSEYVQPLSILVDKMGNILVGETNRITKWTPDIKSSVVVTSRDSRRVDFNEADIDTPSLMAFDKFSNLYVRHDRHPYMDKFLDSREILPHA
jgi:hypothetical protein